MPLKKRISTEERTDSVVDILHAAAESSLSCPLCVFSPSVQRELRIRAKAPRKHLDVFESGDGLELIMYRFTDKETK